MKPKRIALILGLLILLGANRADASPNPCTPSEPCHLRMRDGGELTTPKGTYTLPPGRFLDEPTWDMLEVELKRLQDSETRLGAENKSLRESLGGWRPGWITVTSFLLLGVVSGVSGYYYWEHR